MMFDFVVAIFRVQGGNKVSREQSSTRHILLLRLNGGNTHTKDSSAAIIMLLYLSTPKLLFAMACPPLSLMMLLLSMSTVDAEALLRHGVLELAWVRILLPPPTRLPT